MAARRTPFALYLDTSALVKLFVREAGSEQVRRLAGGRHGAALLLASRLGFTEASVSLARLGHLGRIGPSEVPRLLGSLDDYWRESIQEVDLSETVLADARQLALRFPLRTYDAIHLASAREAARTLRGEFEGDLLFLAFDAALLDAATAVGFTVPRAG